MIHLPIRKVVCSPAIFLMTLVIILLVFLLNISPSLASSGVTPFTDVTGDDVLYNPYINRLHEEGYVSGYTGEGSVPTGDFAPERPINRAEMTKIAVYIHLTENDDQQFSFLEYLKIITLSDSLKYILAFMPSFKPQPFDDVPSYSSPGCVENKTCEWYTPFICYAANKGIVQGTGNGKFEPAANIVRLHALKILMADDGSEDFKDKEKFKQLSDIAAERNAKPHCLVGAENYIRAMNKYSANPAEVDKLLEYALLADRLDLFGPQGGEHDCEVFGKAATPRERALYLQKKLTRGEMARFAALSSLLDTLRGGPAKDPTVDTYPSRPPYRLPAYTEPTDVPTDAEIADDPLLTETPSSPNPDNPQQGQDSQQPSSSCTGSSCEYKPDTAKGERWITPLLTTEKSYDGTVNLRTEAKNTSSLLSSSVPLVPGDFIIAVGQPDKAKWQEVRYYDGRKAYVFMEYMKNASEDNGRALKKFTDLAGSYAGFGPDRLPRISCPGNVTSSDPARQKTALAEYDWMLKKGTEEKLLGYLDVSPNADRKVFAVEGGFLTAYKTAGGVCGSLGAPITEVKKAAESGYKESKKPGTTGTQQSFEHGRIYKSPKGTFPVSGNIFTLHANTNNEQKNSNRQTHTASFLGFPVSAPDPFTSSSRTGRLQNFEGGKIFVPVTIDDKGNEKEGKAVLVTEDSCEYANYGFTVPKRWPEGAADPDKGVAIRISPKDGAGWTDGKCNLVFSKLDSSGKPAGTPASFAKQTLNDVTTWKASFAKVTKSAGVSCGEQTYAVMPAYPNAPALETFTWSVGSEESCIHERLFKTSIPDAVIRAEARNDAHILKTIPAMKTEITVIGKAVDGDYNDTYKTKRWYPVRCPDCKDANGQSVSKGYVVATVVHPEFIEFQDKGSQCGNRHQIKDWPVERVVLHGTAGSSLSGALSTFSDCTGAHFYVGRDGEMVQVATIDKLIWHAGYVANKSRTELVDNSQKNSYTSIGVEIANLGLIANQSDTNAKDIDTVFPNYWGMWKEGLHWGTFKDQSGQKDLDIDSKKWQFYTDEQYKSLDKLLSYVEESTGIPYKVSLYKDEDDTSNNTAYYYHPLSPIDAYAIAKTPDNKKKAYEQQTKILNDYLNNLYFFQGVVDHHANAGKWDTGPAFDICNKYLNFQNIQNFCKN